MNGPRAVHLFAVFLMILLAVQSAQARDLTFEERVSHQRAIEEVYWTHRIWPATNPGPKPGLDAVLTDTQIRARVADYLKKSNALADFSGTPITAAQLQTEMDRMAAGSSSPAMLQEIFDSLGNDPFVVAETLARQKLADRLVRRLYADDEYLNDPLPVKAAGQRFPGTSNNDAEDEGLARPPGAAAAAAGDRSAGFDAWWADVSAGISEIPAPMEGEFTLAPLSVDGICNPDRWRATPGPDNGAPTARDEHTAVWTGSEMIVWGGYGGSAVSFNDGGVYDPATDAWSAMSTTGVPATRHQHSAVWTGTEVIVWGGFDHGLGKHLTGGRYNPTTDSWAATAISGAPAARDQHTAVWTGSEMIVWGGSDDIYGDALDTGGRYDPLTDTWAATTTSGAPIARTLHTAVWTGSEMIVWSGIQPPTNTGGRYDPSTDTWTATTTVAAPTFRSSHTAVWTGSEMIIFGGEQLPYTNAGGRYDPATDSWTAPATPGAAAAREYHTAVWTGTEMIVWGGYAGGSGFVNTGGRYNPATDSWTPTSTGAGVPVERRDHSAIWTGSEMIVWGGSRWTQLADGSRYCVQSCATPSLWHRDADGDGFANLTDSVYACTQPAGYIADPGGAGDCDDLDVNTWPGASEINDGKDNQCPGDEGYGVADEIAGSVVFNNPFDWNELCWTAQGGATSYEITRSPSQSFATGCTVFTTGSTCYVDTGIPVAGERYFYLLRPLTPFAGSWGADSFDKERVLTCSSTSGAVKR